VTIVRVGSNHKYAEGWETAFSKGKKNSAKPAPAKVKATSKPAQKASTKKKAAGKKPGRKK
jgi:hypothetical protein